ncbi:polysialyltransferase family glycosyltransferase [Acinetobacter johnsonii]|uniref:polysialyltransferase family glycosyltransferase n=1 Tax=Acinetobacter johnsonii TaxID=40214 RepID=UPI0022E81B1E|nr:polysialyltransferase family glycosyltransferase [Acinetobacter johnsonii]
MGINRQSFQKVIIGYSIVSPLHLINFLSYLQSCDDTFDYKYVFLNKYWSGSIISERYISYCKQKKVDVIFCENEKERILKSLFKSEQNIYFVCVKNPNLYVLRKGFYKNVKEITVIDEGLSSYAGFFHTFKASLREKGIKGGARFLIYIQVMKIISFFIRHKINKFTAFHNKDVNPTYKKYFLDVLKNIDSSHYLRKVEGESILFCTQPLIEVGLMSYDDYMGMLTKVDEYCRKNKISLLIKKHPVDNIFEYSGYNVLDFDGVVEEFVLNQKNIIGVISSCSTSSLLIPAFMNKKSYIVSFESLNGMDSNLKKLFERYCESIENIGNTQ